MIDPTLSYRVASAMYEGRMQAGTPATSSASGDTTSKTVAAALGSAAVRLPPRPVSVASPASTW